MPKKKREKWDGVYERKDRGGRYQAQWSGPDVHPDTPENQERERKRNESAREKAESTGRPYKPIRIIGTKVRHTKLLDDRFTNKEAAMAERARLKAKHMGVTTPTVVDVTRLTLNHFAEQYLQACSNQKGIVTKRQRIRRIIKDMGTVPIASLSQQRLREFREGLIGEFASDAERRKKEKTANRYVATLKAMIRWADDEEGLEVPSVALDTLAKFKMFKESPGRIHFFYLDDAIRFLQHCTPDRCDGYLRPLFLLALGTGIRRGDLLKLRWEDIDVKGGLIYVGGESGTETKGGQSHTVEIGGIASMALEEARKWLAHSGRPDGRDSHVIDWRSRDRLIALLKRDFKVVSKAAGIPKVLTFHCARHSFCTWALAHGEPIGSVQYWMGHSSVKTTQRYKHYVPRGKVTTHTVNPVDGDSDRPFRKSLPPFATSQFSNRVAVVQPPHKTGTPGATRTRNPRLRRPMLYPVELRARGRGDRI